MWWPDSSTWMPFGVTSTDMPADLVPFNHIRLLVQWNQREKLLNRCPFIRHANLNCETLVGKTIATLLVRHTYCCSSETSWLCRCSCSKYVYWPSVTSTKTAAVQTCLLVECYCKMGACWTVATHQYGCRSFTTESCMIAGAVLLYLPNLLLWCLTISCVCWCGASL